MLGCVLESESSPGKWDNYRGKEGKTEEEPGKGRERGSGGAHWSWLGEGITFDDDGAGVGGEESGKQTEPHLS